jgi:hypothetical protein
VITKIINGHPNSRVDEPPAVGLSHHPSTQGRGLKTALTIHAHSSVNLTHRRVAYGRQGGIGWPILSIGGNHPKQMLLSILIIAPLPRCRRRGSCASGWPPRNTPCP